VNSLDFVSPTVGASSLALDGNTAANRTAKSASFSVTVNPGQEIWLRWVDIDHASNDHGLAIDDFSFTPHAAGPEINVQGGVNPPPFVNIANGDATPSLTDGTDFGSLNVVGAGTVTRQFNIENLGTTDLTLTTNPR
jgi:hypothetical protein